MLGAAKGGSSNMLTYYERALEPVTTQIAIFKKTSRGEYMDIAQSMKQKMNEIMEHIKTDLSSIRTGRASAALVDSLSVQYYGSTMPLKQMASISVPEPTVILIQPWDKQAIGDVEQAIRNSNLGLSPINEGSQIRLVLPPLTEERREELIKTVHQKAEAGKVGLRTVRKDTWDEVQKQVKSGSLTEDDRYRYEGDLNKIIDQFNREVDEVVTKKESELRTI
jgi:ribosome recycling factor